MFTAHLLTRVFHSAAGKEFTATRDLLLRFPPYAGLHISFGRTPLFRVKRVVYDGEDGSFTLLEANMGALVATDAAFQEWAAGWRAVGFAVDSPDPAAPQARYLKLVT